jgi:hypothetical protein
LPGKRWRRTRGLLATGLWPRMGGGAPAVGRQAARREHGRGELYSGGLPVWEEARWHREVVGGLGRLREASACGGVGRKGLAPRRRALAGLAGAAACAKMAGARPL